ncbi:MAG TPA: HdeD family acid-resistance protein, partial [Candidatus Competibacteraceae bacterium]|nr:HdeD family acid-resistance protein [Candidatus Competibacteraceae bacterium]
MNTVMKSAGPTSAVLGELQYRWGWLLALGILEIVLGIIGLGIVAELTLASVIVFGVFLVIEAG